ncbi:MAG: tetratricopeptide repeat protein [Oligoflexales bacterium]|nr:tetratricopeptide repeat protein [Oligoflexales bacterium]
MGKLNVNVAVVFTTRADVRNALRQELKKYSIESENIINVRNASEYKKEVADLRQPFFLMLDWETGADKVLEVLELNKTSNKMETRPTFLITAAIDERIISVAKEYHVSRIHSGPISPDEIKKGVGEIIKEMENMSAIKQLMLKVEQLRSEGKLAESSAILEQLYAKFPTNPRVIIEFSENYMQGGKWEEAGKILEHTNKQITDHPRLKHLYARYLLKMGKSDAAIASLKDAQLLSPFNIGRLIELGDIFLENNRAEEAKSTYSEILKFAPESKQGKLGKSKGMLLAGEVNEALSILKDAANTQELAAVFNTSAILAMKQGNHDAAFSLYDSAITAIGDRKKVLARLFFNKGIGYVKVNKPGLGLKCFEKASEMDPEFSDACRNAKILKQGPYVYKKKPSTESPDAKAASILNSEELSDVKIDSAGEKNDDELQLDTTFDFAFEEETL